MNYYFCYNENYGPAEIRNLKMFFNIDGFNQHFAVCEENLFNPHYCSNLDDFLDSKNHPDQVSFYITSKNEEKNKILNFFY